MKTLEQILANIIEATTAKPASDDSLDPPRTSLVEFKRDQLLKVLEPRKHVSRRAADLFAGVTAVGQRKTAIVGREHLLVALGALEEEGDSIEPTRSTPGSAGDV